jgi:hypothetical protein
MMRLAKRYVEEELAVPIVGKMGGRIERVEGLLEDDVV